MPKKQKRFKSEQAILEAIDAMDKKQKDKYAEADELELIAKNMAQNKVFQRHEIQWKLACAEKARRSAGRAASKKVELGKALSGFRTLLLPLTGNEDTSVVL